MSDTVTDTQDIPILYTFRRCPYAMRARMALAVSGVKLAWREVLLRDKPAQMLKVSEKGTVPVLLLSDGVVIDESLDIMLWALSQNDPDQWLPEDGASRIDQVDLIKRNDGPFKVNLDRYKYANRYKDIDSEEHRSKGFEVLSDLNERLSRASFLAGSRLGLADIAIFPFIRQFRIADPNWFDQQSLDYLQSWLMARMGSSLFETIMMKRAPWVAGDEEFLFAG